MAERFLIEVVTRFKSEGLPGVIKQAQAGLAALEAKAGSQTPRQAQRALTSYRTGLEKDLLSAQKQGLMSTADIGKARAEYTRLFNQPIAELAKLYPALGRKLQQAVEQGIPKPSQQKIREAAAKIPAEPQRVARKAEADRLREEAQRKRVGAEAAARDQGFIDDKAATKAARQRARDLANAQTEGVSPEGLTGEQLRVRTAAAKIARTNKERADANERALRNEKGELDELVRRQISERKLSAAVERRAREEQRAANGDQRLLPGGSAFQRAQALLHNKRSGELGDPGAYQTAGQFIGSKALTTAGYAVSGALLYGGLQTVKDIVKETEQLQRVLAQVEAQFNAIGQPSQFAGFRSEILSIARDTGVAADEVATIGFQMKGAFGTNTSRAIKETGAAIRASVVTGIPQKELTDSLTGAAISFGTSIEEITDKAIGLEERFGVLARESLKVFGDMAASADSAGLSVGELGAILGVVQRRSAQSGATIAEGLNRVLPAVQESAAEIIGIYGQIPGVAKNLPKIQSLFAEGKTGEVILQLVRDYDSLDETTKKYLKTLLGGRREAKFLDPLFAGSSEILKELARDQDDTGKTTQRFNAIQSTLSQTLARMREELRQLGTSLARAGLYDAFKLVAGGAEILLRVVGALVRFLGDLNQVAGGVPGKLLAIAAAVKTVQFAIKGLLLLKGAGALIGSLRGGGGIGGAATVLAGGGGPVGGGGAGGVQLPLPLVFGRGSAPAGTSFRGSYGGTNPFLARAAGPASLLATIGGYGAKAVPFTGAVGGGTFGLSGAALGAATLGVGVATMAAIDQDLKRYKKLQDDQSKGASTDDETFRGRGLRQLLEIKKGGDYGKAKSGLFEARWAREDLGALFTGNSTGAEKLDKRIEEETVTAFEAAAEEGLFSAFSKKEIAELRKRLTDKGGGGKQGKRAREILEKTDALNNDDVKKIIGDASAARETTADKGEAQVQSAADLTAAFQAGEVGYDKLIAGLNKSLHDLKGADRGVGTPEIHKKVLELQRQINATVSQTAANAAQLEQGLLAASGASAATQLTSLTRRLADPRLQKDPQQLLQVAQAAQSTQSQAYQDAITNAQSADEALALGEGGQALDPATRKALVDAIFKTTNEIINPADFKATAEQIKALKQQVLQEQILKLQAEQGAELSPEQQAAQALDIAQRQRKGAVNDTERFTADIAINNARKQARDIKIDQEKAAIERRRAENLDPAAQAQADLDLANLELREAKRSGDTARIDRAAGGVAAANQGVKEAGNDIARARLELLRASAPEDSLAQAQLQQREADQAAAEAVGVAAQLRAQAQRVAADKAVRDAVFALGRAQVDMLRAMMERTGDLVGIANLNVQDAQAELARLRSENAGPVEIQNAQNALFRAETAAGDAQLQEIIAATEHELQMKRISRDQAVARLRAAQSLADGTQEKRDLESRIQALLEGAGTDLQFDLPANLKLPTLYEARRLNQSGDGGYQDNRQIAVTLMVTPDTYDQAFSDVQTLVQGQPQRFGGGRLY